MKSFGRLQHGRIFQVHKFMPPFSPMHPTKNGKKGCDHTGINLYSSVKKLLCKIWSQWVHVFPKRGGGGHVPFPPGSTPMGASPKLETTLQRQAGLQEATIWLVAHFQKLLCAHSESTSTRNMYAYWRIFQVEYPCHQVMRKSWARNLRGGLYCNEKTLPCKWLLPKWKPSSCPQCTTTVSKQAKSPPIRKPTRPQPARPKA